MSEKRVVITGLGTISPLGNDTETTWENAIQGKSGATTISKFNIEKYKTKFACEVKGFDPTIYLDKNEIRKTDLFTKYALHSSSEAILDSGIKIENMASPYDIGVIWGTGQGGMNTFEDEMKNYVTNDFTPRFNPFFIPKMISNIASGWISMKHGFMGLNYTAVSACATSNTAIMDAFNYIKLGKAKVIVTGGSESPIHESSIGGFSSMKALSTRNEDPTGASRPFDINRDGFVMGEGGACLILEEYEHAKKRGAKIYAEVAGAAMTADAYHLTATHPEGEGAYHAMQFALDEAQVEFSDLDYLNAHATSTPVGDISEIKAVHRHLKKSTSNKLHISGTKSMTGHLLGGAGAIEAIFCVKAIQKGIIPPTINIENVDPEIPASINLVKNHALQKPIKIAMSNTFGFGGHNSTVIFKAFE